MAYKLTVFIVDPGDKKIHVEHNFYGKDRAEAETMRDHHLQTCEYFRNAENSGYTDEQGENIDNSEWPEAEETDARVIDMELDT
jgi:hypothetical protein